MKNLRQILRRPVGDCDAVTWEDWIDNGRVYAVFTKCDHLKVPRVIRVVGDAAQDERFRDEAWERALADVRSHQAHSKPW